jgi:hypothetical protein
VSRGFAYDRAVRVAAHLRDVTGRPDAARVGIVAGCIAALVVALAVRYPDSFADANRTARENASLDYLDRELGGGNSGLPDQSIALEARGWIPPDEAYTAVVGPRRPGWSPLVGQQTVDTYLRYFLLPRRPSEGARWVVCVGCDQDAYPSATTVWEDPAGQGLAVLRLPP